VCTGENLSDAAEFADLKALQPDLIFSFYYRNMIPVAVLELPKLGAYNLHGSYLPSYRGRAPVNWSVVRGETKTGATLHAMVAKPDAGEIIDQEAVAIGPDDTSAEVQARVTQAAVAVISRQIDNLENGKAPRHEQDLSQASYFGRRRPEDGRIDWSRPAVEIHNLIRGVSHPYPGAYADVAGSKTFFWRSRVAAPGKISLKAGEFDLDADRLLVGCGDGNAIEILRVQRNGDEEVDGAEFGRRLFHTNRLRGDL
jgi:methionyl-tRNA formyltransferase